MTERIDHARIAAEMTGVAAITQDTEAVNHAILALVEQQRIANLIALAQPIRLPSGGEVTHMLHDPASGAIREDVAEGLGL